jgi:small subunit ribosomal protein S9
VADETTPPEDDAAEQDIPAPEGGEESPQGNAPAGDPDPQAVGEPESVPEDRDDADAGDGGPAEPAADAAEESDAADDASDAAAATTAEEGDAAAQTTTDTSDDTGGDDEDDAPAAPREKPAIPGMDLEVDIVMEGEDALGRSPYGDEEDLSDAADEQLAAADDPDGLADQPIAAATIDLAADARYTATGKRKTAIARVILKAGTGAYTINGKTLDEYFPRPTLQRNIRQPLEAVGYEGRMDVIARMHGGGVAAQAGALRHGISRALIEADPNLRGELKRRGFLTRDARVKERKKAGLKKARKRPQFSKR